MKVSEIKKLYKNKDSMHDWTHILRIKKHAHILKKSYKKIDMELLEFLLNFHGQKDFVRINSGLFNKNYVKSLLRHNKNPQLKEEKLVFDANMLDNVGKNGIKKALYMGNKIGRSKEETYKYLKDKLKDVKFYTIKGKKIGKKSIIEMNKIIKGSH